MLEYYGNWLELRVIIGAQKRILFEMRIPNVSEISHTKLEAQTETKPECSWLNFCCHLMCGMIRIILSQDAICYVDICCKHIIRCVSGSHDMMVNAERWTPSANQITVETFNSFISFAYEFTKMKLHSKLIHANSISLSLSIQSYDTISVAVLFFYHFLMLTSVSII